MKGYFILKITVDSLLTDPSLRQTPDVGPCRFPVISLFNYILYKSDISLRRTTTLLKRSTEIWQVLYVGKNT